jgi:hypothetical protein
MCVFFKIQRCVFGEIVTEDWSVMYNDPVKYKNIQDSIKLLFFCIQLYIKKYITTDLPYSSFFLSFLKRSVLLRIKTLVDDVPNVYATRRLLFGGSS